jgi:putative hydrolase of HD superfamily
MTENPEEERLKALATKHIEFSKFVGKLKRVKRTGWVRSGVDDAESVADHMFRMAWMAMSIGQDVQGVDVQKAIKMALVHDLAEAKVGDLVIVGEKERQDKITKAEKAKMELEVMTNISQEVGGDFGKEVLDLFNEFEAQETPTAKFLGDLDKLEMIIQCEEYEVEQNMCMPSFFKTTKGVFKTPLCQAMDAELRGRHGERCEQAGNPTDPVKNGYPCGIQKK